MIVIDVIIVMAMSLIVATLKAHGLLDWLAWIGTVAVTLTALGLLLRVVAAVTT